SRRSVSAPTLTAELKRELDWIPLKAMAKDRTRRYRTPAELADDVRNYLAGKPLAAAPDSAAYKLRKLLARHRGPAIAMAAVAAALVLGIAGTTWMAVRARSAERAVRAEEIK